MHRVFWHLGTSSKLGYGWRRRRYFFAAGEGSGSAGIIGPCARGEMMNQVVIYIGVLTEYQGIDLLLEAIPLVVREATNLKFLIVGYPNEDYYRQKARALGIASWVHFTRSEEHTSELQS